MNKGSKNSQHYSNSNEVHSNKVHHDISRNNTFSHAQVKQGEEGKSSVEGVSQNSSQDRESAEKVHHDVSYSHNPRYLQDSQSMASHEEVVVGTSGQIQELERSVEELKKKWMYAEAESQNIRARAKREIEEARQYAIQKFAKDIVEVAENLQRALESLPRVQEGENSALASVREGVEGIERSLLSVLERYGVQCHHSVGKPFDAHYHEAMAEQESDQHAHGTVIHGTPAWTLHGRLLKPAMVVVSKSKP